jgi:hypothetical protein
MYLTTTRAAIFKVDEIEKMEELLTGAGLSVLQPKDVAST